MRLRRRGFLKFCLAALSALPAGLLSLVGCRPRPRGIVLDGHRRSTLEAATSRILPSEDGPGAIEAGVVDYIERALRDDYFRTLRRPMERGLDLLESLAADYYGRAFAECRAEEQDAILMDVQAGKADTPDFPAHRFFERLVMLTLEGFLCDPVHGGNRNCVGWKFIGYVPGGPRPGACPGHRK